MTNREELRGKSAQELEKLAKLAKALADDLRLNQPSYELALQNGVVDKSYDTVANGTISSYGGEAIVRLENGTVWECIGRPSTGSAHYANDGYIEFIPIIINRNGLD